MEKTEPVFNIPSEEEMKESHRRYLDDLRSDPNNLSFWYPKVKEAAKRHGILTPKTVIIPVPDEVIESFGFENDGDQERVRTFVHDKVMPQLKHIPGLPFIKNGTFSDKFQFKTCCPDSADEDTITKCISDIQYDTLYHDTGGNAEIVLRERIESPGYMPRIYGGMPLNTEFRVFYDFDRKQALYASNYWDRDYCRNAIARRSEEDGRAYDLRYPSLLAEFEANRPDVLNKAHTALREADGLTGIWSVDFLLDSRGRLWLIDMAVGYRSAYWDPARATVVRNQAETKLYLDENDPAGQPDIAVWVRELFRCAREDGREFIALSNRAVVNAWEKTHPETTLPKEEPERTIVFIDTVNPGEPALRRQLDIISRQHHAYGIILETLTAIACEKVVNDHRP